MSARSAYRSPLPPAWRPARAVVRRSAGTWTLQATLHRHGLGPVAGVDEAGRGRLRGPARRRRVRAPPGDARRLDGLTDSKLLTPGAREEYYALIMRRCADSAVVVIPPEEVDRRGVHVANVEGMRRAVAALRAPPGYVLTDGFPVRGFGRPALAVPKGDQAAACVAAASVLAKVTRDRIMVGLHAELPAVRVRRRTRATARRCTTPRSPSTAPARCTGTRSSTSAPLWEASRARPYDAGSTMSCSAGRGTTHRTQEECNRERRGSREVRDRDGAHALQGVPGHRLPVLLRGGDRAPLLPGQLRGRARRATPTARSTSRSGCPTPGCGTCTGPRGS